MVWDESEARPHTHSMIVISTFAVEYI